MSTEVIVTESKLFAVGDDKTGFHAHLKDCAMFWGVGRSKAEALGNLVLTVPRSFNISNITTVTNQ